MTDDKENESASPAVHLARLSRDLNVKKGGARLIKFIVFAAAFAVIGALTAIVSVGLSIYSLYNDLLPSELSPGLVYLMIGYGIWCAILFCMISGNATLLIKSAWIVLTDLYESFKLELEEAEQEKIDFFLYEQRNIREAKKRRKRKRKKQVITTQKAARPSHDNGKTLDRRDPANAARRKRYDDMIKEKEQKIRELIEQEKTEAALRGTKEQREETTKEDKSVSMPIFVSDSFASLYGHLNKDK